MFWASKARPMVAHDETGAEPIPRAPSLKLPLP